MRANLSAREPKQHTHSPSAVGNLVATTSIDTKGRCIPSYARLAAVGGAKRRCHELAKPSRGSRGRGGIQSSSLQHDHRVGKGCLAVALELIRPVRLCTCASVETDMFGLVVVVVVAADTGLLPVSHTVPL